MKNRNPKEAFENAIKTGAMTTKKYTKTYFDNFQYMDTDENGTDGFRNYLTHEMLFVRNKRI